MGLSYGSTACMFSCMPFLTPLLVKNSTHLRQSFYVMLPFSLGRVFSYTLIAMMALSSSALIKTLLNDKTIFQTILGVFTMSMGIAMLYHIKSKKSQNCRTAHLTQKNQKSFFGLFGMGALISFNPCLPILTLIGLSANSGTVSNAMFMGMAFGFGAVMVPFFFYGFFLSSVIRGLLEEFKKYTRYIELFASMLLIVVGILVISGQVSL